MRKIKLELNQLSVQSFPTTAGQEVVRGTVRGNGSGLGCATAPDGCVSNFVDASISADGGCLCQDLANTKEECMYLNF